MSQNKGNYTLDGVGDIYIYQPQKGYRFSVDSLLLFLYSPVVKKNNILDIGAGTGILSFLFADKYPQKKIISYEIQKEFVKLMKKGIKTNKFKNIQIKQKDIKKIDFKSIKTKFDLVVCNPPYRKYGHGRLSPYQNKNIAIYDKYLKISDLLGITEKLMNVSTVLSIVNLYENKKYIKKMVDKTGLSIKKEIIFLKNNTNKFIIFHIKNRYDQKSEKKYVSENEWKSKVEKLYNK
ncbi:MAG: methyltransferase domain-containing protein [Candidatus Mcinerneyibacterium aminivorans]|jgi:tRNA1(Val) A37 N6-methylase TrmN6|uniref:Methyltransferase domain-containing protein n=1 Tax=Candidatus Mcinerneyibacterium aminivorans TaxID=2703815 RepID=A0A5D0MNM2_9BACT|nr:MAG: methyltransferase domain-containing protein [Candidatus Mcinerneyibacterium aminivorans]